MITGGVIFSIVMIWVSLAGFPQASVRINVLVMKPVPLQPASSLRSSIKAVSISALDEQLSLSPEISPVIVQSS